MYVCGSEGLFITTSYRQSLWATPLNSVFFFFFLIFFKNLCERVFNGLYYGREEWTVVMGSSRVERWSQGLKSTHTLHYIWASIWYRAYFARLGPTIDYWDVSIAICNSNRFYFFLGLLLKIKMFTFNLNFGFFSFFSLKKKS